MFFAYSLSNCENCISVGGRSFFSEFVWLFKNDIGFQILLFITIFVITFLFIHIYKKIILIENSKTPIDKIVNFITNSWTILISGITLAFITVIVGEVKSGSFSGINFPIPNIKMFDSDLYHIIGNYVPFIVLILIILGGWLSIIELINFFIKKLKFNWKKFIPLALLFFVFSSLIIMIIISVVPIKTSPF